MKTVVLKGTRGSNPLASAIMDEPLVQMKSAGFSAGRNSDWPSDGGYA